MSNAKPAHSGLNNSNWRRTGLFAAGFLLVAVLSCPFLGLMQDVSVAYTNALARLRGTGAEGRWRGNQTVLDSGVTIVLLNYKRPDNIRSIVKTYLGMPETLVRSVLIFNNNPTDDLSALTDPGRGGSSRVTVLGASENVGIGNNRFFAASLSKTRAVVSQDDDLQLSQRGLEQLLMRWQQEPDRVHGTFCRGPRPDPDAQAPALPEGATEEERRRSRPFRYAWGEQSMSDEQVGRQRGRVEALQRLAGDSGGAMVDGTYWTAPRDPLRAPGMSDAQDRASACPVLITRIVAFDRTRAYYYFRWVLEMQDTVPKQKPFGHGEDLLLSLLSVRESGGKLNRVWRDLVAQDVAELPSLGVGVSAVNNDHVEFRSMYMRLACNRLGLPCWDWIEG